MSDTRTISQVKADTTARTLLVHEQYRSLSHDEEVSIPDLLCGIMHFLNDYFLDFDEAIEKAKAQYEADMAEQA